MKLWRTTVHGRMVRVLCGLTVAFCSLLPAAEQPGVVERSAGTAYLYHYLDPLVVYQDDESTTMTLELATTGQDIARVRLLAPTDATFHDDGTHGDRVAGDGIYTLNGIPHSPWYSLLGYGTHGISARIKIDIESTSGSHEQLYFAYGIVAPEYQFTAIDFGDGLSATSSAFFIVDPAGDLLDTADWPLGYIHCGLSQFGVFEKLYSVYDDSFDFVIIMPAHAIFDPGRSYGENVPYYVRAKNEVQHIGIQLFDNTHLFHSQGRLMGMIYHSWGGGAILDHEIGHAWAADMGEVYGLTRCDDGCYGNHWNPRSDIGGQMGAFLFHPDVQYGAGHLHDNGDGTWRIERVPDDKRCYSELELYVMGLIPPQEVPPIHLLINPDTSDDQRVTAERVEVYTIDDLMAAEGGERVPSYESSRKRFNIAFVVVKNKEFTAAEYAFYSLIPRYFASTEQGAWSLTTFYTATGGRARLDPLLPQQTIRHGGRRLR
jgi:hypothetical protein